MVVLSFSFIHDLKKNILEYSENDSIASSYAALLILRDQWSGQYCTGSWTSI